MQHTYLCFVAVKDLEQQRGKKEADECDDYRDCDVTATEDADASHQLIVRCGVDATEPERAQRQQTYQQNYETDKAM